MSFFAKFLVFGIVLNVNNLVNAKKDKKLDAKEEFDHFSTCNGKKATFPAIWLAKSIPLVVQCAVEYDNQDCQVLCGFHKYGDLVKPNNEFDIPKMKKMLKEVEGFPEDKMQELVEHGTKCAAGKKVPLPADRADECTNVKEIKDCIVKKYDVVCGYKKKEDFLD